MDASKEQLARLGDLAVQVSDNRDTMTMADGALFARVRYVGRVLQSGTSLPEGVARDVRLEIAMWVQAMRDLADAAVSISAGLTVLFDMETANSQKEARDLLRKARENVKACRLGIVSPDPNRDLGDPVA